VVWGKEEENKKEGRGMRETKKKLPFSLLLIIRFKDSTDWIYAL
jgi:hypothetical protein